MIEKDVQRRARAVCLLYTSQLEKNGVHLVSAMEPISQGPEGIMLESMLIGMAEYYSAELALKGARGERENALLHDGSRLRVDMVQPVLLANGEAHVDDDFVSFEGSKLTEGSSAFQLIEMCIRDST